MDDLYSELYDDLTKAKKSENLSKKIISSLENDLEKLRRENNDLLKEVESLKSSSNVCSTYENLRNKIINLNKILENFTSGKKNLEALIGNQRCAFNKEGLGYILGISKGFYKNFLLERQ